MPDYTAEDPFDPHMVPRAVSALNAIFETRGYESEFHAHPRAELILALRGLITCQVADGLWLVPPQSALWIPGGVEHQMRAVGDVEAYILFLTPDLTSLLPCETCTLFAAPLLRELIIAVSRLPVLYDADGPPGRLITTLLDELATASIERLYLPYPADPRLRKIADALTTDPSSRATSSEWAEMSMMSERTLHRLILKETGMSFGRWRKQFQIMLALDRLARGESVQSIAYELGYESPSAFITMFRKMLGHSPGKYLSSRGA